MTATRYACDDREDEEHEDEGSCESVECGDGEGEMSMDRMELSEEETPDAVADEEEEEEEDEERSQWASSRRTSSGRPESMEWTPSKSEGCTAVPAAVTGPSPWASSDSRIVALVDR